MDDTDRALLDEADTAKDGAAGLACERAYDTLTLTLEPTP